MTGVESELASGRRIRAAHSRRRAGHTTRQDVWRPCSSNLNAGRRNSDVTSTPSCASVRRPARSAAWPYGFAPCCGGGRRGGLRRGCTRSWRPAFVSWRSSRVLRRDLPAVEQALTSQWSNGPVEGHINRLKMIKRQMYGRAGFERLRARVLPWEPADHVEESCTESA